MVGKVVVLAMLAFVLAGCASATDGAAGTSSTPSSRTTVASAPMTRAATRPAATMTPPPSSPSASSDPGSTVMSSIGARWAGEEILLAAGHEIGLTPAQAKGYALGLCPVLEHANTAAAVKSGDGALLARLRISRSTPHLDKFAALVIGVECPSVEGRMESLGG